MGGQRDVTQIRVPAFDVLLNRLLREGDALGSASAVRGDLNLVEVVRSAGVVIRVLLHDDLAGLAGGRPLPPLDVIRAR
jgi:hypothetical protein